MTKRRKDMATIPREQVLAHAQDGVRKIIEAPIDPYLVAVLLADLRESIERFREALLASIDPGSQASHGCGAELPMFPTELSPYSPQSSYRLISAHPLGSKSDGGEEC